MDSQCKTNSPTQKQGQGRNQQAQEINCEKLHYMPGKASSEAI